MIKIKSKVRKAIILEVRGDTLRGVDLKSVDLRKADLRNADLQNANLCNTNLQCANLRNIDLQNANLCNANLQYTTLCGANLRGANLQGADLRGTDLDYSCWPLGCGSIDVKIGVRIAKQLIYHALIVMDKQQQRAFLKDPIKYANGFHRIPEVSKIERK